MVGLATAVGFFISEAVAGFMENPGWGVFQALVAGSLLHVLIHRSYPVAEGPTARGEDRLSAGLGALGGVVLLWILAANHGAEPAVEGAAEVFRFLAKLPKLFSMEAHNKD